MSARFAVLRPEQMTAAQSQVSAEIAAGPRGAAGGPFVPLLRSPSLASAVQKVGEYLRYGSVLPACVVELAVLMTATAYRSEFEFQGHAPLALAAGLSSRMIHQLRQAGRPDGMEDEVAAAHDFVAALLRDHAVGDEAFAAAREKFGEQGVIELTGVCGYYALLAMVLNVGQVLPSAAA